MNVINISFEDDVVVINWSESREQGRYGGTVHQTYITQEGMNTSSQLQYWANELQDDAMELLSEFQKEQGRIPEV